MKIMTNPSSCVQKHIYRIASLYIKGPTKVGGAANRNITGHEPDNKEIDTMA